MQKSVLKYKINCDIAIALTFGNENNYLVTALTFGNEDNYLVTALTFGNDLIQYTIHK